MVLTAMKPMLNTFSLNVMDTTAWEMGLPEIDVRVGTSFFEALKAETLTACSICMIFLTWYSDLFNNISFWLCLDHISSENCLEDDARQQCY